jgi:hypothetical protein
MNNNLINVISGNAIDHPVLLKESGKKIQLLEKRMNVDDLQQPPVVVEIVEENSNRSAVNIDSSSNSRSKPFNNTQDKENVVYNKTEPSVSTKKKKRTSENTSTSSGNELGKSPKLKKIEETENSPEQQGILIILIVIFDSNFFFNYRNIL